MKQQFRLYRRNGGIYYIHDSKTGKQESLHTRDRAEASALFAAKTQSHRQAHLNLRLARTYLAATDPMVAKRTWLIAMEELAKTKRGETHERWRRALKDKAFALIRDLPILETQAEHFLKVLNLGKVSTNVFLRRIHNFALDLGWLPWPIIVKRQWPAIEFKEKRAITWEEHCQIVEHEKNPERRAFYQMAWHMGASQSDLAFLEAKDIDWEHHVISFARKKTGTVAIMRFGEEVVEILRSFPRATNAAPGNICAHRRETRFPPPELRTSARNRREISGQGDQVFTRAGLHHPGGRIRAAVSGPQGVPSQARSAPHAGRHRKIRGRRDGRDTLASRTRRRLPHRRYHE